MTENLAFWAVGLGTDPHGDWVTVTMGSPTIALAPKAAREMAALLLLTADNVDAHNAETKDKHK